MLPPLKSLSVLTSLLLLLHKIVLFILLSNSLWENFCIGVAEESKEPPWSGQAMKTICFKVGFVGKDAHSWDESHCFYRTSQHISKVPSSLLAAPLHSSLSFGLPALSLFLCSFQAGLSDSRKSSPSATHLHLQEAPKWNPEPWGPQMGEGAVARDSQALCMLPFYKRLK